VGAARAGPSMASVPPGLPELPLALPEEVPHGALLFPGGSPVIFSRSSFLSPGAIARVVGAWRGACGPPLPTRVERRVEGDGVKCGS